MSHHYRGLSLEHRGPLKEREAAGDYLVGLRVAAGAIPLGVIAALLLVG